MILVTEPVRNFPGREHDDDAGDTEDQPAASPELSELRHTALSTERARSRTSQTFHGVSILLFDRAAPLTTACLAKGTTSISAS